MISYFKYQYTEIILALFYNDQLILVYLDSVICFPCSQLGHLLFKNDPTRRHEKWEQMALRRVSKAGGGSSGWNI